MLSNEPTPLCSHLPVHARVEGEAWVLLATLKGERRASPIIGAGPCVG